MPKIVFVNRFAPPDHSATSQILGDLAFHLAARGEDVHIVTSRQLYGDPGADLPPRETVSGVDIHRVAGVAFGRDRLAGRAADYLSFFAGARAELSRLVTPGDIVVLETDPPLLSVAFGGLLAKRGVRVVNWLQDVFPEIAVALRVPLVRGPAARAILALRDRSLRNCAVNVVLGERMREHVAGLGVDRERVVTIPNWSADDVIVPVPPQDNPLRREWGLADSFVVAYSGNLGRAHEYETALEAARRLRTHTGVKFLFIGDGHHIKSLKARVEAEGLSDTVRFRPYQTREALSLALGTGDVHWLSLRPDLEGLIVPSKFYGIAAAGRPTLAVTAADGEIARWVRRHDCGVQIDPGDGEGLAGAILSLEGDPSLRRRMGENARALADALFTRAAGLRRWVELLDAVRTSARG